MKNLLKAWLKACQLVVAVDVRRLKLPRLRKPLPSNSRASSRRLLLFKKGLRGCLGLAMGLALLPLNCPAPLVYKPGEGWVYQGSAGKDPAATGQLAGELVGDRGSPDRLVFEGNHAYTREEILAGLGVRTDFYLVAHPAAPLSNYLAAVQDRVRSGYQRGGFPEVAVATSLDKNATGIVVRVNEGPRYRCGEIRVTGGPKSANEAMRSRLVEATMGIGSRGPETKGKFIDRFASPQKTNPGRETNCWAVTWSSGAPAPFDEDALDELTRRTQEAMAGLGYFNARMALKRIPDNVRGQAELQIEIEDAGPKGVIQQLEVTGNRRNTRQQVLTFLDLKPGMEITATTVEYLENRLYQSARFLRHEVSLTPLATPGHLKLTIALRELEKTPPLDKGFPPETQGWLKFRNWLSDFENHKEDLVCDFKLGAEMANLGGQAILSPAGLALLFQPPGANGDSSFTYTVVLAPHQVGLYSGARQRKLTFERKRGSLKVFALVEPNSNPAGDNLFNLNVGAGFGTEEAGQPVQATIKLAPAAFTHCAASLQNWSLEEGILKLESSNAGAGSRWQLNLDAASGRLESGEYESPDYLLRFRSEAGAFARATQEIATVAAPYRNDAATDRIWSSIVSFLAVDLVRGLPALDSSMSPADGDRFAGLVEKLDPGKWFIPLEDLDWSVLDQPRQTAFTVPAGKGAAGTSGPSADSGATETFRRWLLVNADGLCVRGSWPWTLSRETAFTLGGQADYTGAEMQRLSQSDDLGPLGCAVAQLAASQIQPQFARAFATRGASLLTLADFRKDWRLLLGDSTRVGRVFQNALRSVAALNDQDLEALVQGLPAEEAAFFGQCVQCMRAAPNKPVAEALWPVIEQHWGDLIEPFLAQAFPGKPQGASAQPKARGNVLPVSGSAASSQEGTGIAATVDGRAIREADVREASRAAEDLLLRQYSKQPENLGPKLTELRKKCLETLIDQEVIVSDFDRQGFQLPPEAVEGSYREHLNKQYAGDTNLLASVLTKLGMTPEEYRERLRRHLINQAMRSRQLKDIPAPGQGDIERYYRGHGKEFAIEESAHLWLIAINKSGTNSPANVEARRQEASAIRARIVAGADFASEAKEHSEGSQKASGGDWGWAERSVLRRELADAAFSLEPGGTSEVIETPEAFYVLRVSERRPAGSKSLADVREQIAKQLLQEAQAAAMQNWLKTLRGNALIQRFPQNAAAASKTATGESP